jgi:hypothetical protein
MLVESDAGVIALQFYITAKPTAAREKDILKIWIGPKSHMDSSLIMSKGSDAG